MREVEEFREWRVRVPPELDRALEKLLTVLGYSSKAEAIRDAVRREILQHGIRIEEV